MRIRKNTMVSILLAVSMLISTIMPVFAQTSDITGHWAASQVNNWLEKGLIRGYEDGTFKPDNNITRAEFVSVLNRALGLTAKTTIAFSDVPAKAWYAGDIEKAKAAGYISGYEDGTFKPDNPISRIEVAKILSSVLKLKNNETSTKLEEYQDAEIVPQWGKESLNSAVIEKYFQGYPDRTIRPLNNISRAEAVTVLYQALGTVYNVAGIYGPEKDPTAINGNVTVSSTDVNIKNTKIEGNLMLTAGIGDGNVQLDNVSVTGRTFINGGGAHSVIIRNSNLNELLIDKDFGEAPKIVVEGNSVAGNVTLESPARLEENNLEGQGFGVVKVSPKFTGSSGLQLAGDFQVYVDAKADIELVSGNVTLETSAQAGGTTINVFKEATLINFIAGASAQVKGEGKVKKADVNAAGVTIQQQVSELVLGQGITAFIAGKILDKSTVAPAAVTPASSEETHSIFESIAISIPATKLIYSAGDNLDITGLQVTGTYLDTTRPSAILPITEENVIGFDSSEPAVDQVLTITVEGKTVTYNITVMPAPDSIAITSPAIKLIYFVGENLDISGLQVTGTYSNTDYTAVLPITEANVSGFDSSEPAVDQVLNITAGGKTATYNITVLPAPDSIAITVPATKLFYSVGDSLDITGLQVTGTYSNTNSTAILPIVEANVTGFNSSEPAYDQELTITIGGKTATYTVSIEELLGFPGVLGDTSDASGIHYGDVITLESAHWRNYISGRSGNNKTDIELMGNIGPWEKWQILKADNQDYRGVVRFNDVVLLKSVNWGNYISGRDNTTKVQVMSDPGEWERFKIISPDNLLWWSTAIVKPGAVALFRSEYFGKYLSATGREDNSKVELIGNTDAWERWLVASEGYVHPTSTSVEIHYGDVINLKSGYFHNYLSGRSGQDKKDVNMMNNLGEWEDWEIVEPQRLGSDGVVKFNDTVAFCSVYWKNYLSGRDPWGEGAAVQVMGRLGPWEKWKIINPADPNSTAPVKTTDEILIKSVNWGSCLSARSSGDEAGVEHVNNTDIWEKWSLLKQGFYRNWMSNTPELHTKLLSKITFPATHDTGTWDFKGNEFALDGNYETASTVVSEIIGAMDNILAACSFKIELDMPSPVPDIDYTIGVDQNLKVKMVNSLFDKIKDLSRCQDYNTDQQLNAGIRWFDLRIYLRDGGAYTHHMLTGVSMDEVLDSIANFCATTKGEIVVAEMSHFAGNTGNIDSFYQSVKTKLGPYAYKPELGNPFQKTYEQVVGENPSSKVILLISEDKNKMSDEDKGFFWNYDELGMASQNSSPFKYSNTTDADEMINSQLTNFNITNIGDPGEPLSAFTLWYTLTTYSGVFDLKQPEIKVAPPDALTIIPARFYEELPAVLTDELLSYIPDWVKKSANTIGFDLDGFIKPKVTEITQACIGKYVIDNYVLDYRSTKDLSDRVNPVMENVLKSQFQSTADSNRIQVIYADFFENSRLVDIAIEYSRDCK